MGDVSDRIALSMKEILDNFEKLRGKSKDEGFPTPFWDIVVITTADDEQGEAFRLQLDDKLKRREIPRGIPYHVLADPPGHKIGNGGSTFHVLHELDKIYGEMLHNKKIFLLHAGGQSQRMPNASVLGKIFAPFPFGNPMYQALELKLAMYLPFLPHMEPGVFVTCSDTIELYNIDLHDVRSFDKPGFTALAHPSPVHIGTGHGVYVLADPYTVGGKLLEQAECVQVLQKPTVQRMRDRGAIIYKKPKPAGGDFTSFASSCNGNGMDEEPYIYSDSIFFFDAETTRKALKFYREHMPLTCEIDAYGDFMQALGTKATDEYVHITTNVSRITGDLIDMRKKVFNLFKSDPLTLVTLNESKFYHVGTTKEYLYHFCQDKFFIHELNLGRKVFSYYSHVLGTQAKQSKLADNIKGITMHTAIPEDSVLSKSSVIEYCDFDVPVVVGDNCIISNCSYNLSDIIDEIEIPAGTFMHTVPIFLEGVTSYATVVFGIFDDLKKQAVDAAHCTDLSYFRVNLSEAAKMFNISITMLHNSKDALLNLWYAELFPVESNMARSFEVGLKMAQALAAKCDRQVLDLGKSRRVSMSQILHLKNISGMLSYRNRLFKKIDNKIHLHGV